MTPARHHAEWLSLVESSGPFLSMPVLLRVFPQGLDLRDPSRAAALRENYEDWLERGRPLAYVHTAWVRHVLENLLEWPADFIAEGQSIPAGLEASQPHFGETLRPDLVLRRPTGGEGYSNPQLLVVTYPPTQDLEKPVAGKVWKASPATRMTELLHASGVPLGLVTNGEHWMVVYAPRGETSGFASWYADLWMQEPVTLRAFHSLLCLRRFFGVAAGETLAALYAESAKDQQEVTEQLGRQVRRAVEMLVQAIDQIDADSNRALLANVPEKEVYDAVLTVMMRLVFLFSSEERGLLLLGDPLFDQHYAVSTLRELLRERADQHGEEVLERRHDAWSRLLATFRAVHGGVQHEAMRLPNYGGSLFDPDRYPFLEGRESGSRWRETPAHPLAVNNRVVLHLLEALQLLRVKVPGGGPAEARRVSFRALDIEQIGHVYEGLLDHTARRATEVTLGLSGKNEPEISLAKLEALADIDPGATGRESPPLEGGLIAAETTDSLLIPFPAGKVRYDAAPTAPAALIDFLKDATGRSANALETALGFGKPKARGKSKSLDPSGPAASSSTIFDPLSTIPDHSLLLACGQDPRLAQRIRPFVGLLRSDDFGRLTVIRPGSVFVTAGTDRRSSGTHYTPRSLTEPIVKHTLDPLVYIGPAEGLPEAEWKLKSPREILALKVCDLAMGSGAFLVQACRYLAERLCEAWELAEKDHVGSILITPDGEFSAGSTGERLLPNDPAERVALARRYVADRCLYGVDINPMAVEMAKLSLWLITLQKDRPFTFLDHAFKCGDSLLGVTSVKQIENFSLRVKPGEIVQDTFATANLFRYVDEASAKRRALEDLPSNDHTQIETKNRLHAEAEAATAKVKAVADCLIALELRGLDGDAYEDQRTAEAEKVQLLMKRDADASVKSLISNSQSALAAAAREQLRGRRPFHWAVEFPEVFASGGFNAIAGNPPYLGGPKLTGTFGKDCRDFWIKHIALGKKGTADLAAYFCLRTQALVARRGNVGFVVTSSVAEGDTREVGLQQLEDNEAVLFCAVASSPWPGSAKVTYTAIWIHFGEWRTDCLLDGRKVRGITSYLTEKGEDNAVPFALVLNTEKSFNGAKVYGEGFVIDARERDALLKHDPRNEDVIFPYMITDNVNSRPDCSASQWAIRFFEWPLDRESAPKDYTGPVASDYPDCLAIVEVRVKPERTRRDKNGKFVLGAPLPQKWWIYGRTRPALYERLASLELTLVIGTQATKYVAFAFVPTRTVFSHSLAIVADDSFSLFAAVSSSIHEVWARRYGSYNLALLRYSPSDLFDTFPLPHAGSELDNIGRSYYEHRHGRMLERGEGLTDTYNRFHNRGEQSSDIARLRALHEEMDQAVAAAYGWSDLDLGHGFHATKQGERYTLSEPARRTVLDRLLALNHQRHAEELAAGLHEKKSKKPAPQAAATRGRKPKGSPTTTETLPVMPSDFRFPAPTPGLYAVNLVTALLSARLEGLRWPILRDAFAAVTQPKLMQRLALPDDKRRVAEWAARWNERATPDFLIQTLREMSGANIAVSGQGLDAVFALQDGPKHPATEDVAYDAWLALHVTEPLSTPVLADEESATLDAELEELLSAF